MTTKKKSIGMDKVRRCDERAGLIFQKTSEIDSVERQRDSKRSNCFKQKKKERAGGTKEPSAWRTLNAVPLSCPPCLSCPL